MAALSILAQRPLPSMDGATYVVTKVRHDGTTAGTFSIDQSASAVAGFRQDGGTAPTVTLATAGNSTTFLKTVTINGAAGVVEVLSRHQGAVASVKA